MKKLYISLLIAILVSLVFFAPVLADDNPPPLEPRPGAPTEVTPAVQPPPLEPRPGAPEVAPIVQPPPLEPRPDAPTETAPIIQSSPIESGTGIPSEVVTQPNREWHPRNKHIDYNGIREKFTLSVFRVLQIR